MVNPLIKEAVLRTPLGKVASYERIVDSAMIDQFADISGDYYKIHMDNDYARAQGFPARLAHGALLVGFMSTASAMLGDDLESELGRANVSLGYDRMRFVHPVLEGDVITTRLEIIGCLPEKGRVTCKVECLNQDGKTVAVAEYIMSVV